MSPSTDLFRTLADGTRRRLYERLAQEGELTVGTLTEGAGVSQPAVSQHLKALRDAGLVAEERRGRAVFYRAQPDGLTALDEWLRRYGRFWRDRFDALEDTLSRMDQ